jgi:sigma-B regulation protein RsbU (phosphoserine phosphatase)
MTTRTAETLPPTGRSASRARRLVEAAVAEYGHEDLADEALLLATELVTNAVVHAGTDLELIVEADAAMLRVEVIDHSPGRLPVVSGGPSELREGGRGIFLLDSLATEWGTRHFAAGKAVWFLLGAGRQDRRERVPAQRTADPAPRKDIAWLVGLPAELEQRISSTDLIGELLHRLTEALDVPDGWLYAEAPEDDRRWGMVAGHGAGTAAPDPDVVRRLSVGASAGAVPGPAGGVVLPLRAWGRAFGAVVLQGAAALTADEVALARLVGDRMSVVLRDERAQASQLRSRGSLALLAEASEMFAGTLDVRLALTLATQLVVPRFGAWAAALTAFEHAPRLVAVAHGDERRLGPLREALSGDEGEELAAGLVRRLVETGPQLIPTAELPAALGEDRGGDLFAVPLVARRRLLGLLLLGRPAPETSGSEDIGLLTDLARRAALALDNARLYEERTAIAHALQASLLPPTLPSVAQLEFGARYTAAGSNDVGGDFYDVFSLPDGGWAMAIGDVCGKGAEAAAITGMARDVLRLLTRDGAAPPAALQRLNDVLLELGDRGRFCTTVLATVEPRGRQLHVRLSSAGHPAPALLCSDGSARLVGHSGTLLGVVPDIETTDDLVVLSPGDALVFYTDGVTERRNGADMFGDERLLDCLRRSAGQSADALAGLVEREVRDFGIGQTRDDLAVLVVRCASLPHARTRAPSRALSARSAGREVGVAGQGASAQASR